MLMTLVEKINKDLSNFLKNVLIKDTVYFCANIPLVHVPNTGPVLLQYTAFVILSKSFKFKVAWKVIINVLFLSSFTKSN